MKNLFAISILVLLCCARSYGQTIFLETFNEGNAATTGTDDVGGVSWTATCPYCDASGDWNEIQAGQLENQDSNGPAYWTTGDIDISSCLTGITISLDLSHTSTLEPAVSGCGGCNSLDIVKLEVSFDGGTSWNPYSDATYGYTGTDSIVCDCGTCGTPSTTYPVPWCGLAINGPTITSDDFAAHSFSDCISVGISSTVQLRITTMTWAAAENILVDNVTLACSGCALPVELTDFTAARTENSVYLNWYTQSEIDFKKFIIQRSEDGVVFYDVADVSAKGVSAGQTAYEWIDKNPSNSVKSYYRLAQIDLNGSKEYSTVRCVEYIPTDIFYTGNELSINFQSVPNSDYTLNIFDLSGKLVHTQTISGSTEVDWEKEGIFLIEIPEIELRHKIVVQ